MTSVRCVWLFTTYNMYDSKRHFTLKLAEAFQRRGIKAKIIDQKNWIAWDPSQGERPDFSCSFHTIISQNGRRDVRLGQSYTPYIPSGRSDFLLYGHHHQVWDGYLLCGQNRMQHPA